MKRQIKTITLGAFGVCFSMMMSATTALSQNCVSNNCATLGFTMNEAYCDGNIIRCPFDTSKVYCKEKKPLAAGDILFSDKTTSADMVDGKTPIGIVVDPGRRLAVALRYQKYQWANTNYYSIQKDVPGLPNLTREQAEVDFNGKNNTRTIYNANSSLYPAARYCYQMSTAGTASGDWFMAGGGELTLMCRNQTAINTGLAKTASPVITSYNGWYWTSSESASYLSGNNTAGFTTAFYISMGNSSSCYLSEVNKYASANGGATVACFYNF